MAKTNKLESKTEVISARKKLPTLKLRMASRNRSSRRTGNQNENEQNTGNGGTQITQGSSDHANPGETYLSSIQTVIAKLDEVMNDVRKKLKQH